MSSNAHPHHDPSVRSRHQPITIVSTDQGPRVGPYIFGKTLGTGSTGKVKLAKNLVTGEIVAIKIVRKDYLDTKPSLKRKMRREISVLKVLSHPNLMSLIDVFEIDTHLFLVMEFVDGLELFEYLVRRGALPIPQALSFFQQIICGLEYCHHRLICHRDLKPENLLLDRNLNIKIADFGMTSLNPPGSLLETSCGSPHYCDPMVVSGEMYDGLKADIWSCGVILYAMVTGRLPFDDDNIQRLLQKVQMGQYHLPADLPKDLRDLLRRMLTVEPEARITLEGIKEHPWFNSIPPRNYVEDNFVVPVEPITDPDPLIMRSLVDLGWGDANTVAAELAKVGPSMEKVFYEQFEQHPMYVRSSASRPRRSSVQHSQHSQQQQQHQGEPAPQQREAPSNPNASGATTSDESSRSDDTEELRRRLEGLAVQNGVSHSTDAADANGTGNSTTTAPPAPANADAQADAAQSNADGEGNSNGNGNDQQNQAGDSGASLIRQSSLRNIAEMGGAQRETDERVEQAIQTSSVGQPKSWFDSMRSIMWSGPHASQHPAHADQTTVAASSEAAAAPEDSNSQSRDGDRANSEHRP